MHTPKDYEIVKIEIIRDNGETIVGIQIGKNSISSVVKNHFGTDFQIGQIKNSERFIISAIRGETFYEEVSINVIPTNCYAKFNQDCREWLVWGKHSGRYGKTTFVEFMERFKKLPCQNQFL